jgi:nitrate reductase NapD
MPVSGIVVNCLEGASVAVASGIAALGGVEVHAVLSGDRIAAVVESDTVEGEVSLVTRIQGIDGVISVLLAYHNFEDEEPGQV